MYVNEHFDLYVLLETHALEQNRTHLDLKTAEIGWRLFFSAASSNKTERVASRLIASRVASFLIVSRRVQNFFCAAGGSRGLSSSSASRSPTTGFRHAFPIDPEMERTFVGRGAAVTAVSYSPDMKHLVSSAEDNCLMLWNFREQLRVSLRGSRSTNR